MEREREADQGTARALATAGRVAALRVALRTVSVSDGGAAEVDAFGGITAFVVVRFQLSTQVPSTTLPMPEFRIPALAFTLALCAAAVVFLCILHVCKGDSLCCRRHQNFSPVGLLDCCDVLLLALLLLLL